MCCCSVALPCGPLIFNPTPHPTPSHPTPKTRARIALQVVKQDPLLDFSAIWEAVYGGGGNGKPRK